MGRKLKPNNLFASFIAHHEISVIEVDMLQSLTEGPHIVLELGLGLNSDPKSHPVPTSTAHTTYWLCDHGKAM